MPLQLRWVGEEDYQRVAQARMYSYAPASYMIQRYLDGLTKYRRAKPGDFLIAERDGETVGTTTSLSLTIWMRGGAIPCQGVAYVGTIKTARRTGGTEKGIASQLMFETLRKAREREQPISALMPFRASYYEHFGYGNAEQRAEWTIPLSILPRGDFAGMRFYREGDLPKMQSLRQHECQAGQCDIETSPEAWEFWMSQWGDGLVAVDDVNGSIQSYCMFVEERGTQRATVELNDWCAPTTDAMLRMFHFLGTLKDQYSDLKLILPGDFPLNRILKETQIPHRQVDHPVASARPFTRMQIRILDHKRALEAMKLPPHVRGKCVVSVRECEGTTSTFAVDVNDGRVSVSPSAASADIELSDVLWASIISADMSATQARQLGLINAATKQSTIDLLDAFSIGSKPFCQEYF